MIDQMKTLLRRKSSCVLATTDGNRPHCSLMAYITSKTVDRLFLVTPRNTRKYRNITHHPKVSLLIDTREKAPSSQAKALTVEGRFCKINEKEKRTQIVAKLLKTHAHLKEFMQDPKAEIICVKINSFLFLNGLQEAHFESL